MVRNINEKFGDSVEFSTVREMENAINELNRLNPGAGFEIPEDGLKKGRDYQIAATSPKKAASSAANGKKGGRPPKEAAE